MINSDDFAKRLEKVIEFFGESASSFSEKIGVQRSSISHILSGRNKPSLDFVLKVLSSYPEVELYWLLNGKGNFPSTTAPNAENIIPQKESTIKSKKTEPFEIPTSGDKTIDRIVIFYSDGTFKNFNKE